MENIGKIRQHDEFDCGAACLCSIAEFYGLRIPMAKIRKECGCSSGGITIKGLIEGSRTIGLEAKGYKSEEREISPLSAINAPFIAHTRNDEGYLHYVVVFKIKTSAIHIMDPACGEIIKMKYGDFKHIWTGYIILPVPGANFQRGNEKDNIYVRMLKILKFHKREIALALAGSVVLVILGLCNSIFIQQIIDNAIPANNKTLLAIISGTIFILLILTYKIGYSRTLLMLRNGIKIDTRLIIGYIRKVFALPLDFFYNYTAGDINSRISDAFNIRTFISDGLISVFVSVITLIASFCLMFSYYSHLAILTCAFIPFYSILFFTATHINKKYDRRLAVLNAKFDTEVLKGIDCIQDIKHYGTMGLSLNKIENDYVDLAGEMYDAGKAATKISLSGSSLSGILSATVLVAGAFSIFGMHLTIGELVSFYTLASFFTAPLNKLADMNGMITEAAVSAERLFEITDMEEEQCEKGMPVAPFINHGIKSEIKITGLKFSYPGRELLFDNFNAKITGGMTTVVTGENGCGKSTLGALLMRDYKPASGHITLNGTDICNFNLTEWRKYVSIIPQRSRMFDGSVLENITSGDKKPDINSVISICSQLGLNGLMKRLPAGLMSDIGRSGETLSGGEIQKLAIARSLYRDPGILIMDEATASLDHESAELILNAIKSLENKGTAVIMITHNKYDMEIADKIIKIDKLKTECAL
ncbi:MAG: peptidase domain-containing ABC transporter [Bacteroidales bacterium]|jgi:ATP-binding cassette subfamily B protein|nr:peptidase domain-containing ABC transporter [Bacteroidales bacterium]